MSLLFVGYESEEISFSEWENSTPYYYDKGIFAIADSAITSYQGKKTLLTGFRKIYDLEAKVWEPYFTPDGYFRDYLHVSTKCPFIIGFAGNTLVAQHILNSITGHMEHLKVSYLDREVLFGKIKYILNLPCEKNLLITPSIPTSLDHDTFLKSDYENLLTGEFISNAIEHSINHAIFSAREHRLDQEEFNQMFTDIFCGVFCPIKKEHQIYIYRMKSKFEEGVLIAYTEKELLNKDDIAVLGMKKQFEVQAKGVHLNAIQQNKSPSKELEFFMGHCIGTVLSGGSFEINRPIVHMTLDRGRITKRTIH
jgi:hypothetical protein